MTSEVLAALRRVVDELGADAGVLVRVSDSGAGVVTATTLAPGVTVGDGWGVPGALDAVGTDGGPRLAVEPEELASLVPTAARLALPAAVSAALVAAVADTTSRLVLLWAGSPLPPELMRRLESGHFSRLTLLAPVLDAQVRAQEASDRLAAVVAALDQAVVVTAHAGGPADVNARAAALLGVAPGTVDPARIAAAMAALRARAVDPEALAAEADERLGSPGAVVRDWLWALRGTPSHLRVTTLPVETVTGTGRIWVLDDVSAEMDLLESERQAARALAESERQARELADAYEAARNQAIDASAAKTAFLSRMSHELRTPLNAVLGFAQLLALDPLTPEQAEAVQHIRRGGRHLLDLINEVLDISRIEAGRLALSMEAVDVLGAVTDAVDLVQPLADDLRVTLTVSGGGGAPVHVHADQQRVRQVLINLLTNAVKYNRPDGAVRVGLRSTGGEVAVDVTDTGPGLPDEMLPRLFQPFDRLGAEGGEVEGTGLGLALADGLARAMGGRIEVVTAVGAGSTFTVVLQESASPAGDADDDVGEPDSHPEGELHILYVEDNPTNATLMERVVALRPGCHLEVAGDGAGGIAAAARTRPDLVLLDLHLPDLGGDEVLRRLRAQPGGDGIPVVVVTADASSGARDRMVEAGAEGFLTKPIDVDEVLGWIDRTVAATAGTAGTAGTQGRSAG